MGKLGYFAIVIGIAMFFVGLFGAAITVNSNPVSPNVENVASGGIDFRTLYLFVVTPAGLLTIVAGDILRRTKRNRNQRREAQIAQAAEARQLIQEQVSYPQFEGLLRSLPNAKPRSITDEQPLVTAKGGREDL